MTNPLTQDHEPSEPLQFGTLVVYEALPQFFKDQSKTLEQMISAGWLAAPGVTP